jgi:tetraacyldisaccharide 4'-kinase
MKAGLALADAWYRGDGWLILLRPLEWVFRVVVWLRRQCFECGLLGVYRSPVPVIVVGNITLGGSGKTPTVIALVQALEHRGIRVGVVSRGYGGKTGGPPQLVSGTSLAVECGEEAVLIHQRTGCPCVVGASRSTAVQALLAQYCVDVIISDDGLQHYSLARDMEIVMYDSRSGFGNGRCLPEGPLREPLARLAQADFLLARAGEDQAMSVIYRSEGLINLHTAVKLPLSSEHLGTAVYAVAGLGQPGLFLSMLAEQGFQAEPKLFPDHHAYSHLDFTELHDRPIIMTEKDAVKCRDMAGSNAWYLKISAIIPDRVIDAVAALVVKTAVQ